MDNSIAEWTSDALRAILQSYDERPNDARLLPSTRDDDMLSAAAPLRRKPLEPEQLEYLRKLIGYILQGRAIVSRYNYVVLATLGIFTAIHWHQKLRHARRAKNLADSNTDVPVSVDPRENSPNIGAGDKQGQDDSSGDELPSSSSSSTLVGTRSPRATTKTDSVDLERQPLLGASVKEGSRRGHWSRFNSAFRAWLMYQPRPIPFVNRSLPSNGTSLFVIAYVAMNVFHHLYGGSLRIEYEFSFVDRAGYIFVVNLPLLYLLAAKNQPIKFLTGYSYEALNIFHRRVGEWMCFEAFVHSFGMVLFNLFFEPDWLKIGDFWEFLAHPVVLLGLGAFVSYELIFFTSLGSFRQRWYELFLASHVILQIAALVFLYLHFRTARPYVLASLAIFVTDRLVWRMTVKSASVQADLQILEDGKTLMLSSNWDIPRLNRSWSGKLFGRNIAHGWKPMDHVFITAPTLSNKHALQAHPFTIASAAPGVGSNSNEQPNHAWLGLLIRAQNGFTNDLLQYAQVNSSIKLRVDGPYGSADAREMLLASETAVLIAGGSGIAVVFPLAWDLVRNRKHNFTRRQIHLFWVIHSRSHRSWIPQDRLDELEEAGVHITIPEPTAEVGRPDVASFIKDLGDRTLREANEMGVVVSGPDALNRTARNACSQSVRSGAIVNLRVEKFGW